MIKRLKVIAQLIKEKQYEQLGPEAQMLKSEDVDEDQAKVIRLVLCGIGQKEYKKTLEVLEKYLATLTQVKPKDDMDVSGLRTVGKMLETQYSVLVARQAEVHRRVNEYRLRHSQEVGSLMMEILKLRREILFYEKDRNPDAEGSYKEAEKDYNEYFKAHNETAREEAIALSREDKKALQQLFRNASKLCHPDVIAEDLRQEAEAIFTDLNNAYYRNDIDAVKEIHGMLKEGKVKFAGRTESLAEKRQLENNIRKLETDIRRLKAELEQVQLSELYQTIEDIEDWDAYFARLRETFEAELEKLRDEYAEKV